MKKVATDEYFQRAGDGASPAAVSVGENHFWAAGRKPL